MTQTIKNLPAMLETWVGSLDWGDPLEEGMTAHSIILAWRIPWTEESGGQQSMGSQRVGHDWATNFTFFCNSRSLTLFYDLVFNIHKPKTLSRKMILIVLHCSFLFIAFCWFLWFPIFFPKSSLDCYFCDRPGPGNSHYPEHQRPVVRFVPVRGF